MRGNRGAAYVLALVTVLVGTVLALAMLQAGNAYFLGENSRTKKQAAIDLAQAGVDYAYWQVHYKARPLPYTADVTLSTGSFHVEATDDGSRDQSTMLITSSGTCGSYTRTVKRVTLGLLPYHYAWCESGKLDTGQTITSTSQGRGIRCNDSIKLDDDWNNITTGLWSTSTITNHGTATPQYPSGPPIAFPNIDYARYSSIADATYNFDVTFWSLDYPSDAVIYVNGNASLNLISGKYHGACTIVATGNITVKANTTNQDADSYLALITDKAITVQPAAWSVVSVLYAHRNDNGAKVQLQGAKAFVGSICADDISLDHNVDIHRDSGMNLDTMRRLNLPGL